MTVDELGQAAATAARRDAASLDPDLMLRRLHRKRHRQQVASFAGVAVVLTMVGIGVTEVVRLANPTPPASPAPTVTAPVDERCNNDTIRCVGEGQMRISLRVPVTLTVPVTFGDVAVLSGTSVESYRTDVQSSGVTVLEDAIPVRNDDTWTRDPTAGTTAASMATWLSKRPFLTGAKVTPTTVGGRPAWRVSAGLKRNAPLRAEKEAEGAVAPTFTAGRTTMGLFGTTMGYNRTLLGEYTLLDIPGAGVTVVWSWTLNGPTDQLNGNRVFVAGLRW